MKPQKVYIKSDNPEQIAALRLFVTDAIANDEHKKLVKKYAIARWTHGMHVLTPEAKAHAEELGLL